MTAKEYLEQAYRLDQKISNDIDEMSALREMASGIRSPRLGSRVRTSRTGNASFVDGIEKVMEMEEQIDKEVDLLVDLKMQIKQVISAVPNTDESLVLEYRYMKNYTISQIAEALNTTQRTVMRWHKSGLEHVVLPKNFIKI